MLNHKDYANYRLEKQEWLPDLEGYAYLLRHEKTKARVLLVDNDDNNKVFSIAFRTPPCDDTGVAHILEHSVLCGSEKYPAKDPFVELAKGSLNTFLNAMTYSDKTVYPIASCNSQDYHNLMSVYLDAVFFPNIYKRDQILKQEGWHYEIDSPDDELTFNGVVYNEMKGVYSSPEGVLERKIQAALLKDTPYAFESGGDPDAIPQLTKEGFLTFHARYYHPSNSYIYLYGNVNFEKELAFIDREYLSKFEYREADSEIPMQEPYKEPMVVRDTYSISDDETDGCYYSYSVQTGEGADPEKDLAMQILDYVLFSMPGAPVKKKLIEAGMGKDVDSYYDGGIQQPLFTVISKNAPADSLETFVSLVEESLKEQADRGIDRLAIQSAINSFEFKYREASFGRYPKGLIYGLHFLDSWLYDDANAVIFGDSFKPLRKLKTKAEEGYFENLLRETILENSHKAYVALSPEKDKNKRSQEELKKQLAKVKANLSDKQLHYLIEDTKNLKEYQKTPSSREEIATIPMLSLKDIPREVMPFKNQETEIGGIPTVIHDYHTNGIVYFNFCFDITELPEELIPYTTMLVDIFRYMDTLHYTYNELATQINLKIGGLSAYTAVQPLEWKEDGFRPVFGFRMKCLEDQIPDGMELLSEVLFTTGFGDKKRLKEIFSEITSKMEERIPASGHVYAANRALSYVEPMSHYKEVAEGMDYYYFIKDLENHFEERADQVIRRLQEVQNCIFRKENLILSLTGQFDFDKLLSEELVRFTDCLWEEPFARSVPAFKLEKKNEGFKTASQVQYVATAGRFASEERPYTGALRVLRTIFAYDYLWNKVRVEGGAYGCMCSFSRDGYGYFTSYRDPNLSATMEVYRRAAQYVRDFDVDETDMTKFIIGTISAIDQPLEPVALGTRSFSAWMSGISIESVKKEREEILSASKESIRALAPYVDAVIGEETICAIGNDQVIEDEKEMFKETGMLVK